MSKIPLRKALLTGLILVGITPIMAQEQKQPTLEDLIPGGTSYRYAENIYGISWWGDLCIKPGAEAVEAVHPSTGRSETLFTLKDVNTALEQRKLGRLSHLYGLSFPRGERKQALFVVKGTYVVYDFEERFIVSVRPTHEKAGNQDYCTASGSVAYTIDNNLYVDGKAVTREPEGVVCGQSVHRNEFGISKGTYWSPKGTLLAFYRMDERMVTEYPLVDITARVGKANSIRYPMAGMTSHKVQVGIYDPATQKTVYLNTGDPTDRYFTNIAWSPDEKMLYLIEVNRDQNHSKLCRYDALTGEPKGVLYEEYHPKYVEPQHPIVFLPWDDTKFVYQSQRDGYNHLYLMSTKILPKSNDSATSNGGTCSEHVAVRRLTRGNWLVGELAGFNAKRKEIFFTAIEGLRSGWMSVDMRGKTNRNFSDLTESSHDIIVNASGTFLIDRFSTKDCPRIIELVDTKTLKNNVLLNARNPYEGFTMPTVETGTLKADDGTTDLYYRIVKPADFDSSKRYPAIVYVYGGPHAQMVTGGWLNGARGWELYMANKGYILFSLDNRGSANRGLAFENATFRRLGIEEGKDQVRGAEFLRSLPYVDADRIGVHGWSFGGHMTTALMLRYPEIFKVGAAGGPVIDWKHYEVMYGERYMDTPESNPEGYKETDLKNLAGHLKGRLLLIHDDHDDTCVPQHTLSFMKACVDARTYPDLFIYPMHKHNVLGRDRVHLHEKITRYFEDYL